MGDPVTTTLLVSSLYASYEGIQSQKEAAAQRADATQAQVRGAEVQSRNARVQAIREARIKRAAILAQAEATGAGVSSGAQGGVSSIESQLASNVGNINVQTGFSQYATNRLGAASASETQASIFQAYAGIGMSAFQASGGFDTIFKTKEYGTKGG